MLRVCFEMLLWIPVWRKCLNCAQSCYSTLADCSCHSYHRRCIPQTHKNNKRTDLRELPPPLMRRILLSFLSLSLWLSEILPFHVPALSPLLTASTPLPHTWTTAKHSHPPPSFSSPLSFGLSHSLSSTLVFSSVYDVLLLFSSQEPCLHATENWD